MLNNGYNPDVLSCLANLSSDEVFTPPALVNRILDMLPPELWSNKKARFLDPFCKSGVFLREIVKRLDAGLEKSIRNRQKRFDHILKNQIFAIAVTELTALLARRSVYCSKTANGKYSISDVFADAQGNIRFNRIKHEWNRERCVFCGASQQQYDRSGDLETHAYELIHTDHPEDIFKMQFDVIIGNPPYQLGSDGGTRDIPIYNKFVDQAKKLNPQFLSMIIPSRWMATGLGLSDFRRTMLEDRRIRKLVDYERMDEVFPGVDFEGGVCYFLWDRDNEGDCDVTTISGDDVNGPVARNLNEYDVFVRDSRALNILHKVLNGGEKSITEILSVDKEFGWTSNFEGFHEEQGPNDVALHYNRKGKRLIGWIDRKDVTKSANLIDTWKVMVPAAYGERGTRPATVLGPSFIAGSPSVCTQTYLFFYVDSKKKANSINSYLRTRFFRFLVSLRKITQHATRSTYRWVPQQSWDRTWTDEALYQKYKLTKEDIAFIESRIRPMETNND
ncbi:MAG TPA: Eco57I restriction-modification methylase domain-containing protein [Pyrinomonadaceae bacterium]|nr:Eco57I restriction-modification methylase domain-containing protein [Pyrinomonadaceae bacterium]